MPAQMLSPLELLSTALVLPSGPSTVGPMPTLRFGIFANVDASQEPPVSMATLPDESRSTSLTLLVNWPIFGAYPLSSRVRTQSIVLTNRGSS